jgi:ferredoxin-like protein FixX
MKVKQTTPNEPITIEEIGTLTDERQPDKYCVQVKCDNCGDEKMYTLEKGRTIKQELEYQKCVKCGCEIIVKYNDEISPWTYAKRQKDNKAKVDDMEDQIDFSKLDDDIE